MAADGDSNNDPEMLESDTDDSINVVEDASEEPSWVTLAQRAAQGMQVRTKPNCAGVALLEILLLAKLSHDELPPFFGSGLLLGCG